MLTAGAIFLCPDAQDLCIKLIFSDFRDGPEKMWHWRKQRCDFSAPGNRCTGCMTCGSGLPGWTAGCSEAEEAHNRGAVVRFLRGGSPF
jgi:hypothetical protein